jgi:hypothetical protein
MVKLYYDHSREVLGILLADSVLRARVVEILPEIQSRLGSGAAIPTSLKDRCERLLDDIGAGGSPRLRSDIKWAVAQGPRALIERGR